MKRQREREGETETGIQTGRQTETEIQSSCHHSFHQICFLYFQDYCTGILQHHGQSCRHRGALFFVCGTLGHCRCSL